MPELFAEKFKSLVPTYLDERWTPAEGIEPDRLDALLAEARVSIPLALREFYLTLGSCEELMEAYHFFWDPDELEVDEDGFLMFLEDENEEYTWGMRASDVALPDPIVYRRHNARGQWISEDGTFTEFVFDHFEWVFDEED
ncbi:hypothetical protein [Falsarthrobacter nasiphocae]|uniref:Knr4/Smi1-like domain-containing protein n=1 Tax=Falsarthrobacter nasiphocae TaxID=189863 RepID=A0AAE3YFG4_9MICC|nr:hypothetical protein [Falsarthrobacter nasiphocae]MDR6892439.1 hypothetical protein [Falsarthrobacter nasiphocae]